jgi:hypothetical protein
VIRIFPPIVGRLAIGSYGFGTPINETLSKFLTPRRSDARNSSRQGGVMLEIPHVKTDTLRVWLCPVMKELDIALKKAEDEIDNITSGKG